MGVTLSTSMTRDLDKVSRRLKPALAAAWDGVDVARWTLGIPRLLRQPTTPTSAVYVAWDHRGKCRYVGSVCRPESPRAVVERIREHMRLVDRRVRWSVITVFPLRSHLSTKIVRICEGKAAEVLRPRDGVQHPLVSTGCRLRDLVVLH